MDFVYPQLNLDGKQVRFLAIDAGSDSETIKCSLEVGDLVKDGHVALSYTWGNDEPSHEIVINGKSFYIRDNLHQFLRQRRRQSNLKVRLWIDAVCIDQANVHERNHQVRQMLHIYRLAKYVLSWLGSDHSKLATFMDFARTCSMSSLIDPRIIARQNEIGESLLAFCNNSYWTRLWIIPEILVARHVRICCGRKQLQSWKVLHSGIGFWPAWKSEPSANLQRLKKEIEKSTLHSLFQQRQSLWGETRFVPLAALLDAYGKNHCADIRDKVFALLPLSGTSDMAALNYSYSKDELFQHMVRRDRIEKHATGAGIVNFIISLMKALDISATHEVYRDSLTPDRLCEYLQLAMTSLEDLQQAETVRTIIASYRALGMESYAADELENYKETLRHFELLARCRLETDSPQVFSTMAVRLFRALRLQHRDVAPDIQYESMWTVIRDMMKVIAENHRAIALDKWLQIIDAMMTECLTGAAQKLARCRYEERQAFKVKLVVDSLRKSQSTSSSAQG